MGASHCHLLLYEIQDPGFVLERVLKLAFSGVASSRHTVKAPKDKDGQAVHGTP
jgi:hypothetical protein